MWFPGGLLDRFVLRRAFTGATAARFRAMRRSFGALDARVAAAMGSDLAAARRFLDVGAGAGEMCARVARPGLTAIALEPSADLAPDGGLRARAEALPLADASIDVALCLSSLRHVVDRVAALRELRRVVTGAVWVVEIDRDADRRRRAAHTAGMTRRERLAFWLWVVKACPPPAAFATWAREAGWTRADLRRDEAEPFFFLRLSSG